MSSIETVASLNNGIVPAWKVTAFSKDTMRPQFVYYECGKCWQEVARNGSPSGLPERREPVLTRTGKLCTFCMKEAMPYVA